MAIEYPFHFLRGEAPEESESPRHRCDMLEAAEGLGPRRLPGRVRLRQEARKRKVFGRFDGALVPVEDRRAEGKVRGNAAAQQGRSLSHGTGIGMKNHRRKAGEAGRIGEDEVQGLPDMEDERKPMLDSEPELKFEGLALRRDVFGIPDALGPIAVQIEARLSDRGETSLPSEGPEKIGVLHDRPLGMYPEAGQELQTPSPEAFRPAVLVLRVTRDAGHDSGVSEAFGELGIAVREIAKV